jgi:dTMP kinase
MSAFITFEGVDGSGKSTQIELLTAHLKSRGVDFLLTREPGGTRLGDQLRQILLDPSNVGMSLVTEAFLYAASRAQLVQDVVRPALAAGKLVLCDRYVDSSLVYQASAGGLSQEFVQDINRIATGGLRPALTILFDLDPREGARRREAKGEGGLDRIEERSGEYHRRVREGYLALAKAEPGRIRVIDSANSIQAIHQQVVEAVYGHLIR